MQILRFFLISTLYVISCSVLFHQMDVDPRGNNGVSTHHHHHYHHHHHHHHHHFVQPPYQVPQPQAYHPYPTPGSMVRYDKRAGGIIFDVFSVPNYCKAIVNENWCFELLIETSYILFLSITGTTEDGTRTVHHIHLGHHGVHIQHLHLHPCTLEYTLTQIYCII